jgi:choice-of-anchor C domain-containing protein
MAQHPTPGKSMSSGSIFIGVSIAVLVLLAFVIGRVSSSGFVFPFPPASAAGLPGTNIVQDGNFETPGIGSGLITYRDGQAFDSWTFDVGSVDLTSKNDWLAADGSQSVDLSGDDAGSIYQDLSTAAGGKYTLSFALAGNPSCAPSNKMMQVWWGAMLLVTLSFDVTGKSTSNVGWTTFSYTVTAMSKTTRLRFTSLTIGSCGPVIDAVAVRG